MIRSLTQACSSGLGGTTVSGRGVWAAWAGAWRRGLGAGAGGLAAALDWPFFDGEDVRPRIN